MDGAGPTPFLPYSLPRAHGRRLSASHNKAIEPAISKAMKLHDNVELDPSVGAGDIGFVSGAFLGTGVVLVNEDEVGPPAGTLDINCAGLIPYDSHHSICICLASPEINIWISSAVSGSSRYLASSFGSTSAIRGSAWLTASTPSLDIPGESAMLPTPGEMLPSATHRSTAATISR